MVREGIRSQPSTLAVKDKSTALPAALFQCNFSCFYFLVSCGVSTFKTCKRICVPDSSFTLSVLETITGPGVLVVVPEVRLRPFNPKTPRGLPISMAVPLEVVSRLTAALPVAAWVAGDCLTVSGVCVAVMLFGCDIALGGGVAAGDRPADEPVERVPVFGLELLRSPIIIEGGSICEGSSTRDLLITGGLTECTTARKTTS